MAIFAFSHTSSKNHGRKPREPTTTLCGTHANYVETAAVHDIAKITPVAMVLLLTIATEYVALPAVYDRPLSPKNITATNAVNKYLIDLIRVKSH